MRFYGELNLDESGVGERFGKRKQIGPSFVVRVNGALNAEQTKCRVAVAQCECGEVRVVLLSELKRGLGLRCIGCRNWKHGLSRSSEHVVWNGMIQRCTNEKHTYYKYYGGRGIRVCQRWLRSFLHFYNDVGPRPSPEHQLDRINNDGHYEPGNIRWVTRSKNRMNTRTNRWVVYRNQRMTLTELSAMCGVKVVTLSARLRRGWPVERAATTTVGAMK
jgi:hypothetical protein